MLAWFGALLRNGSYEDLCECHGENLKFLSPDYSGDFREYIELVAKIRIDSFLQFMFSIDHENKIIKTSYHEIRDAIGLSDITDGRLDKVFSSLAKNKYQINLSCTCIGGRNETFVLIKMKEL